MSKQWFVRGRAQAGEGALQALQEELSHADLLVHEARSMMGGKPAAAGRAAAGAASQAPAERGGSASRPRADAANAPEMPPGLSPFEQLVFRLTHQVVGPEVGVGTPPSLVLFATDALRAAASRS